MSGELGFAYLTEGEVEEVASRAWQNVAPFSTEYAPLSMLGSLADLSDLPEEHLEYRARLQYLLSAELTAFLRAVPKMLNRLAQTTETEQTSSRVVLGRINWPATVVQQMSDGPGSFVSIRNETHRDLPENRLLRFLLLETVRMCEVILAQHKPTGWHDTVTRTLTNVERFLRHPLLTAVPAQASRSGLLAASSSRTPGYRELGRAFRLYESLFRERDSGVLLELFRQNVLVPTAEDRAFELLVLFRLLKHLDILGAQRTSIRLIGRGLGPTFSFRHGVNQLDVHFQNLPLSLYESSLYRKYLSGTAIPSAARRPDLVVRVVAPGGEERFVLLEVKCSSHFDTIRDGAFQLLGYLCDFQLTDAPGIAVVVVAYGPVPRRDHWPQAAMSEPFPAHLTDLEGLNATLTELALTG